MHIKKLEIIGFKSFVDRTVVHFDHDVIGIVGPNGCGKSNIVDAIRWCMGEQSARHLRGKAMEDVIFNGSESRGPSGLAEVTITFDNSDPVQAATLPPEFRDYSDVAVSRRLYRDGTSEYLINKTLVRLRDVVDLFLGTGVGTKAYSIVEQGRIGQIVSARPEDRRIFLEEAAGITKYKLRRKQAERKMELTRQNLLRITDIVGEIERNRNSLKRQVAKAERFLKYRSELEDLVLHEASHRWLELVVLARAERDALGEARTQAEAVRGELGTQESALDAARSEALGIEESTMLASNEAFRADNEVTARVAEIQHAFERLGQLGIRLESGQAELGLTRNRLAEFERELEQLEGQLFDLVADEQARETDAAREAETLAVLHAEESRASKEAHGWRDQSGETERQIAAAEARLEGLTQRIRESRARLDRLTAEREDLEGELGDLRAAEQALGRSVVELAEGKLLTREEQTVIEQQMDAIRSKLLESERDVHASRNEVMMKKNRLRALEDLHRRLEGVGTGARTLLLKADSGVLGMVADRIEAPAELTQALAGLLGDRLGYVIVSQPERGLELLDDLRRSRGGRASVVPARPAFVAGSGPRCADDPPILGRLVDRLVYAPEDEALVRTLVGDAVLVAEARDALELVRREPGLVAVALDGTVARPDGVLSGGSGDDVASALIEQKREMHSLTLELGELASVEQRALAAYNGFRAQMSELGTALDQARKNVHEGELCHMNAEKDLVRTRTERERLEARAEALGRELGELAESILGATQSEHDCTSQLAQCSAQLEHLRHELTKAEERAVEWRERVAAQASLVTERKVRLAQIREQTGSVRAQLARASAAIDDHQTRTERLDKELWDAAANYGQTAARIVLTREALGGAREQARLAHQRFDESSELLDKVRHGIGHHETELRQLREKLALLDEAVHSHAMRLAGLERDHEYLLGDIRKNFRGLDLARVVGDYHRRLPLDDEHRRQIHELGQLIERMGPVNLDARAEYEEADRRFTSLSRQKDDIEQALVELERAIKHMNRESRRRFRETFDAVNALFQQTFVELFNGGRGELKLTDPDDLLASGVDIIAQPPGKKLGNIELMSGGEKALTATALIFAIFRHKPSPFCVLDEVDAPLDEANVARYTRAIRLMTEHSQFILITHVRKTMQEVDVLYGVTMGEPGVSRLVSVKVNESAVVRSGLRANVLEAAQRVA
jgi:chromosome segregation protein